MAEPSNLPSDHDAITSGGYAPYGQLLKMLLPSAGSVAIYDAATELVWCSDGYERPDLRALLERLLAAGADALAGPGSVRNTSAGVPAFLAALRCADGRMLGALVVELGQAQTFRPTESMVVSLLRPVLDCLESRMNLESTLLKVDHDDTGGLDLLLSVDEDDREDASALHQLLRHCVEHLGCVTGALLVPDKNLAISSAIDGFLGGAVLLERTQKHLLAWAQLNNRPMVVNRVASATDVAPYKILSCPVRDPQGRVIGLVVLFRGAGAADFQLRDVRILEFVSRKAVGILGSQYDSLTGLVNRLIFERRTQRSVDAGSRGGQALLYIDIDKLQTVNEAHGFHAGDEVIRRVADLIRSAVDTDAIASRMGGDRFAVFLPQCGAAQATNIGKQILAAAAQLGYADGADSITVSVSIGVVSAIQQRERVAHLVASAELACKRAKQQGRNRLAMHEDSAATTLTRRRHLFAAASLQESLQKNHFQLEAQPIIGLCARAGETVGYELLVRMRNAAGELLAPDKFLDAAERYELLPAIDRWVLCSAVEAVRTQGVSLADIPYCFTANVSAQSLASRKYASFALEQLAQADLPPEVFCFEIKESVAVTHLTEAEQFIRDLTRAGCKIAIDNFGCGMSSLAHLNRLPVHYLKIDGRFVRRVTEDRVAESIVSGITRAARTLGVRVIAEHVENAAMADKLRDLEVGFGQGFFLGRPQAFSRVAQFAEQPQDALRATQR